MVFAEGKEAPAAGGGGGQRLVTADGTYATQSALSAPGVGSASKKSDEKRWASRNGSLSGGSPPQYFAFQPRFRENPIQDGGCSKIPWEGRAGVRGWTYILHFQHVAVQGIEWRVETWRDRPLIASIASDLLVPDLFRSFNQAKWNLVSGLLNFCSGVRALRFRPWFACGPCHSSLAASWPHTPVV